MAQTIPKLPPPLEKDVQGAIVEALELAGFWVQPTVNPKQTGPSGVTKGIPDLLVYHDLCPFVCLGLEVKRPKLGKLSPEQKICVEAQRYKTATTEYEALIAAEHFYCSHHEPNHPAHLHNRERISKIRAV